MSTIYATCTSELLNCKVYTLQLSNTALYDKLRLIIVRLRDGLNVSSIVY